MLYEMALSDISVLLTAWNVAAAGGDEGEENENDESIIIETIILKPWAHSVNVK